ncbi:MAG TPA: hypothetical protein VHF47_08100 [Acidimicrobiales bacterium]|nr:hypothetical protein [Acidimicrobiales bacterium]
MTTDMPELPPEDDGVLDRLRDAPVGTNDPTIVGNLGPTDVPPGEDPPDAPSLDAIPGDDEYGG